MPALELTGQRFGRLLAVERKENDKRGGAMWLCVCMCGVHKIIKSASLVSGNSKSCGCLSRELSSIRCKFQTGNKHPLWRGGLTPENTRVRKSEEYKNWRTAVFVRDAHKCQKCGAGGEVQAHHLNSFSAFPELRFEVSNGQTLCLPCHKKTPSYLKFTGSVQKIS